jgi:large subunit ribosomal protein L20
MPRARGGNKRKESRKKILALAKGFKGKRGTSHRIAKQAVMKALKNSYIGRRLKKRNFRSLWITRIGAASKQNGLSYSTLIGGLEKENVAINRKMLADIAVRDPGTFSEIAKLAKGGASRG